MFKRLALIIVTGLLLIGCSEKDPDMKQETDVEIELSTKEHDDEPEEESEEELEEGSVEEFRKENGEDKDKAMSKEEIIREIDSILQCNEDKAGSIYEMVEFYNITDIVSIEKVSEERNDLILDCVGDRSFQITVNKQFFVDAIKDMISGEYLYAVIE